MNQNEDDEVIEVTLIPYTMLLYISENSDFWQVVLHLRRLHFTNSI